MQKWLSMMVHFSVANDNKNVFQQEMKKKWLLRFLPGVKFSDQIWTNLLMAYSNSSDNMYIQCNNSIKTMKMK